MSPLDEHRAQLLLRNVAMLDLVALPLAVLTLPLNELLLTGDAQVSSAYDWLLPYLVAIVPLSFGGVVHQLIALSLPKSWSARQRRAVSVMTSPIVLTLLLLILEFTYFLRFALPGLIALVVYNALTRLPADNEDNQAPGERAPS